MKKIYASVVVLLLSSAVMAQVRTIRLGVDLVTPANGTNIEVGVTTFSQDVVITVLGPDEVKAGDTLLFQDVLNTSAGQFWIYTGRAKQVNDTFHIVKPGLGLTSGQNGNANYCVSAFVINAGVPADSVVVDSVYRDCNVVTIVNNQGGGLDVKYVQMDDVKSRVNRIFPNPATTSASLELNMARTEEVSVKIVDLAGRVVLAEEKGRLHKGQHTITVNTSGIAPGLYLYQVSMGKEVTTGKFNIK